ncbi:M23 family metallopeptidase [Horticoccus luteus]|uniref:M23 family metallopeptidase n=1 Tax=Horticoccus luteus TaxID=2862869 RepID=A0A8F9XMQ5_9BACT|nr:M23 family metallopeptidase [Horticoccus luteus]QYM80516.1 M23 family metallopeptidase [Horticoccus luteus]
MRAWRVLVAVAFIASVSTAATSDFTFTWPTPNPAFMAGKGIDAFLQQAGSGDPASGGYGGVRSGGKQFHEGLDLKPVKRDRRGEPTDEVFAAINGIVRYVNSVAGNSSYGRYIVLEHPGVTPAIYTLYAHLNRIAPGVRAGVEVRAGEVLGVMGHTAGGYTIPRDRAHLHFEMGVMVTQSFQRWYDQQKFGSRNDHGLWNGMNLMGFDPQEFLTLWRGHRVKNVQEYLEKLPAVVRVKIATKHVPDFVRRYPSLLRAPLPPGGVAGWEIEFDRSGIPFAWTPLNWSGVVGLAAERPQIISVDVARMRAFACKNLAVSRRGGQWAPGRDLHTVLAQLFGLK